MMLVYLVNSSPKIFVYCFSDMDFSPPSFVG